MGTTFQRGVEMFNISGTGSWPMWTRWFGLLLNSHGRMFPKRSLEIEKKYGTVDVAPNVMDAMRRLSDLVDP